MLFRNVLYNNFFIVRKEKKITASRKDYQWSVLKRCPSSKLCDFRITAEFRKLTGIEWHGDAEESLNCVTRWSMCGERLFDRHWWYVRKAGCCNQFAVNWSRCDAFFPLFFFFFLWGYETRIWHGRVIFTTRLFARANFIAHLHRKISFSLAMIAAILAQLDSPGF